jgi:predicted PurR-regulated permease PerM
MMREQSFHLVKSIRIWNKFYNTYAPQGVKTSFSFLKENVLKGISGYLKAQIKLIGVTFIVVLIVLRVENALTIAILAGIFDVLPLLGVSTLFIPWIIYLFITENIFLAVWLIALLVVVLGTRQVLEPKIIGDSLGVSASVMLAALIISINILGFVGLLISPIIIILIKALAEQGYLKAWLNLKPVEKDIHTTK